MNDTLSSDTPTSQDVFIQASVTLVVEHLERIGKKPAELEETIRWDPADYRGRSLAEWLRCEEKTSEESARAILAILGSIAATPPGLRKTAPPNAINLPKDAAAPLYGSRPAEGYRPPVPSFIHEVADEPLDAFGQKLRLLGMVLRNLLFGDPTPHTAQKSRAILKTLKNYLDVGKQVLGVN